MTTHNPILAAWRTAPADASPVDTAVLRAEADRFARTIKRRNALEYAAGVLVLAGCVGIAVALPLLSARIGAILLAAGTVIVLWQLHRRALPLDPAREGGMMSITDFHRRELERQRDALASVFSWYLLPLIPGAMVLMAVPWLETPVAEWEWPPLRAALPMLVPPLIFTAVWALNRWGARRLQAEIDRLGTDAQ